MVQQLVSALGQLVAQRASAPQHAGASSASVGDFDHQEARDARDDSDKRPSEYRRPWYNDRPPIWDGQDPATQLEPCLKLCDGWVDATGCPPAQRCLELMKAANGDLKKLIDAVEYPILTSESGATIIRAAVVDAFPGILDNPLLKNFNATFYDVSRVRRKGESMISYVARRKIGRAHV